VVGGLFFLQVSGVREQDLEEVRRRPRRVDAPPEAVLHEPRQVARVVDVAVGQDHPVHRRGLDRQTVPVAQSQLLEPLVQPAVDEQPSGVRLDEVLGPRDGPGRTEELERGHGRAYPRSPRRLAGRQGHT